MAPSTICQREPALGAPPPPHATGGRAATMRRRERAGGQRQGPLGFPLPLPSVPPVPPVFHPCLRFPRSLPSRRLPPLPSVPSASRLSPSPLLNERWNRCRSIRPGSPWGRGPGRGWRPAGSPCSGAGRSRNRAGSSRRRRGIAPRGWRRWFHSRQSCRAGRRTNVCRRAWRRRGAGSRLRCSSRAGRTSTAPLAAASSDRSFSTKDCSAASPMVARNPPLAFASAFARSQLTFVPVTTSYWCPPGPETSVPAVLTAGADAASNDIPMTGTAHRCIVDPIAAAPSLRGARPTCRTHRWPIPLERPMAD